MQEKPHARSVRERLMPLNLQFFAEEKTEQPTQKRKKDARERGQVAKTNEFSTSLLLLGGFATVYLLADYLVAETFGFTRHLFSDEIYAVKFTLSDIHRFFIDVVWQGARLAGPFMAAALIIGLVSQTAQVGFLFTTKPLQPKLERINPLAGFKRIFSKRAIVELLKALLKVILVTWVTWLLLRSKLAVFPELTMLNPADAVAIVGGMIFQIGLWIGMLLVIIAAADYAFQRYELRRNLMMTKKEVREELKETEGDPLLRSRLRQRQREIASRRMMAEVPTADVVVTNPTHLAVALRYDASRDHAPVVVAKGAGRVAERIKAIAKEHDIPVVEDVWLARTLYHTVAVGMVIPETLYKAVAELLAFVYRLKRKR